MSEEMGVDEEYWDDNYTINCKNVEGINL